MAEIWGIAAAAVGGSVIGGLISSSGAQSAAQTQANAAEAGQAISQNEFNTITGQEQPYMNAGYGAQAQLDYLLGIGTPGQNIPGATTGGAKGSTPWSSTGYSGGYGGSGIPLTGLGGAGAGASGSTGTGYGPGAPTAKSSTAGGYGSLLTPFTAANFKQLSPAYNFQLQQGQQGTLNSDAAGAGALSGAAQKDLMSFNQNLANTSFNNAFNQYQTQQGNIYQRLAGIAQQGQASAANTGQQGTALAGQAAQSATNVGSALAAGQVGSANAWSGAISGASSALPWLYNGGGGGYTGGSAGNSTYVAGTPYGSGANSGDTYCDYALKTDIEPYLFDGQSRLQVYEFRYKGEAQRWRGYMAQEVLQAYPEAVSVGPRGFLKVDYRLIPSERKYPEAAWAEVEAACLT
jgi:hypothetical protein